MRPTELSLRSGVLPLPAFLPDGTRAVVRTLDSADLESVGIKALMVNLLHLSSSPGVNSISSLGGIHDFMGWQAPVMCDSGGFQVYSLLRENPSLGSIGSGGFSYKSASDGKKEMLSPEKSIEKQFRLGADIVFCLDVCTHPEDDATAQRRSVELTISWAKRCKEEWHRQIRIRKEGSLAPLLYGIVQGGSDPELRRECALRLQEIGFDGYGYGGWPIGAGGELVDAVAQFCEITPAELPRHALGIGSPENTLAAASFGFDTFDCVMPTRDARHKRLYVYKQGTPGNLEFGSRGFIDYLHIQDTKYIRDKSPVDESCDCLCCRRYSRAYMHHLFQLNDSIAHRLATMHNLRVYTRLMARICELRA